jgi:hypothetical protein
MRIREPGILLTLDPRSGVGKFFNSGFGIKHPESATLQKIVAGTGFVYGFALFCTVLRVASRYGTCILI